MTKIKRILVKSLLCLSLVLGATLFISFDADASCESKTRYGFGGCACDGTDWEPACWTISGECILGCDGHSYPNGIESWEEDIDYGRDLYGDYHTHHIHYWAWCELCNHVIQLDQYDRQYHHYHNWQHHGDWYRPNSEPCQIWANNYYTCNDCGAVLDADDTFLFWDHNQGIHWKETDVNGDRYHALWCNRHGWVNSDDCANHPQSSGSYAGLWNGVNTTSGTLKYYYHKLSPTNYGDSMHYKCTDCGHTHSLACTLTSTRADNNAFIGKSNINTAFTPADDD